MGELMLEGRVACGPFRATAAGLEVVGQPSAGEWREALEQALGLTRSLMWVVGDLLVYGREHFPEEADAAASGSGYAAETIRVAEWVARQFPSVRRLTELSFSHHQEAAALDAKAAAKVLRRAAREKLPTREVRRLVREEKKKHAEPPVFLPTEENDAILAWLVARRESWPEVYRPTFFKFVGTILENLEKEKPWEVDAEVERIIAAAKAEREAAGKKAGSSTKRGRRKVNRPRAKADRRQRSLPGL